MKKIVLFLVILIIIAFILPNLLNAVFTIGILAILTALCYITYRICKFYFKDKQNE